MMTRKKTLLLPGLLMAAVILMTAQSAFAETQVFTAVLLPANETTPVPPSEQGGSGTSTMTFSITRDASNNITAATATFVVTVTGLPAGDSLILSHIHNGAAGVAGPVVLDSGLTPGTAIVVGAGGGASFTKGPLTVSPTLMGQILANPGGFYFNVHSVPSPAGVMRGQLTPQQAPNPPGSTVPTLSEWGAIIMGLLIAATGLFFVMGRGRLAATFGDVEGEIPARRGALDWKFYFKAALAVDAIIALGLVALSSRATPTDVMGALTSGLIVAFVIQMFVASRRQ
jgi:hypothetical protein